MGQQAKRSGWCDGAQIALAAMAIVVISSLLGCGSEIDGDGDRCPPGATYDSERDRCLGGAETPDTGGVDEADGGAETGDDADTEAPDLPPSCALDLCGDECVDLQSSTLHCGQCNASCEMPRSCEQGQCQCPDEQVYCDPECVDVLSNDDHCGQCNAACPGGEVCVEGGCHPDENVGGVVEAVTQARATQTDCGQYGTFDAVGPVQGHPLLHEAAQMHADDMAENDHFDHTGTDGSSFSQRMSAVGYSGWPVGENIAAGGSDPAHIVQRWLDSDGHCRNIMNGSANEVGVGFALGGQWGSFWVLKLGGQ